MPFVSDFFDFSVYIDAEEDVLRSYDLHANCYVTKPVDLEKFIVVIQSIDRFWLSVVTLPPGR